MANEKKEMGLDRREFLKAAGLAGVGLAGCLAGSLSGCATTETPKPDIAASLSAIKPEPVVYPKLPYNKIQAPESGCMVGFRKVYAALGGAEQNLIKERQRAQAATKDLDELLSALIRKYRHVCSSWSLIPLLTQH